ncbi:hypothetical protein D3C80_1692310 [compost metagenome]
MVFHLPQKVAVILPDQLCGRQRLFVFGVLDHRDHPAALLQMRDKIHLRVPEIDIETGMGQIE